jgi:excisionase family DNA binding protein
MRRISENPGTKGYDRSRDHWPLPQEWRPEGTLSEMNERIKVNVVALADVLPLLDHDRHMAKREAAQFLGIGVRTLETLQWEIPHFRVGSRVLFRRSELIRWMNGRREQTTVGDLDRVADEAVRAVLGKKNR